MAQLIDETSVKFFTFEFSEEEVAVLRCLVGNLSVGPENNFDSDALYEALGVPQIKQPFSVKDFAGNYIGPIVLKKD